MTTEDKSSDNKDNKNPEDKGSGQEQNKTVPLDTFLDQKKINKELKEKLAAFEDKERKDSEAKLLEEKKFQEVIQNTKSEAEKYKSELEQTKKEAKIEKIKDKFSRFLEKNNAINADDALKFVQYDDLLDSEDLDGSIKKRVEDLAKNKAYLFSKSKSPSNDENGKPNSGGSDEKKPGNKVSPTIAALTNMFSST